MLEGSVTGGPRACAKGMGRGGQRKVSGDEAQPRVDAMLEGSVYTMLEGVIQCWKAR